MPGVYQVEYFYLIPVLAEQLGGIVIELRLRIRNDRRLSALEYGEFEKVVDAMIAQGIV